MQKILLFIITIFVFLACSQKENQRIQKVRLNEEFYQEALDQVSEAFVSNPSDELLRRKLYYLKQLNWPEESIETLQLAQEKFGLTDEIVHNLASYYFSREYFDKLTDLLKDWKRYAQLDRELAQAEILLFIRTNHTDLSKAIFEYAKRFDEEGDRVFIKSKLSLVKSDTSMIKLAATMASQDPDNVVVDYWLVPSYLQQDKTKEAIDLLSSEVRLSPNNYSKILLAKTLYDINQDTSKLILRHVNNYQSSDVLSMIFEKERKYDSALHYTNKLIELDSSKSLVFRKAGLYEKRGWLSSSFNLLNILAKSDTTDSIALKRANIVSKKIAYLRSLKELERDVPMLDLKSKNQVENE